MKDHAPDHRKMKALARLLRIPLPFANGIMERLWHATANHCPDGGIGRLTDDEIAEICAMPIEFDPSEFVGALAKVQWLDACESPVRFYVHDWHEHCTYYTHRRLARARKYFANGTAPSLARFTKEDRGELEKFYLAQSEFDRSEVLSGRPKPTSGRPERRLWSPADVRNGKMDADRARATDPTPPDPTRPHPNTAATEVFFFNQVSAAAQKPANGKEAAAAAQEKFPLTSAAIASHDPGANGALLQNLLHAIGKHASEHAVLFELITDQAIASAIEESYRTYHGKTKHGAGLLVKRVPEIITHWAKENT